MGISEQQFQDLLGRNEGPALDFKARGYNLSNEAECAAFVKDVLCIANTPRESDGHIVLGVKKHPDGTTDLWGLDTSLDGADLQTQFKDRVYPLPDFTYDVVLHGGKSFGVIVIPPTRRGPCVPTRDFPQLRRREVYLRRDSMNDVATPEEIATIVNWVNGEKPIQFESSNSEPWTDFLSDTNAFAGDRAYILVSAIGQDEGPPELAHLGGIGWTAVVDMDPATDRSGLHHFVAPVLKASRAIHLIVSGDRITINRERATYWLLARGLEGRASTVCTGPWKTWLKQYQAEVHEQLRRLAAAILPSPVTVVVLAYDTSVFQHLQSILQTLVAVFADSVEVVIATDDATSHQALGAQFDAQVIPIRLHDLCAGLHAISPTILRDHSQTLPTQSGATVSLKAEDALWFEEELELVYLDSGGAPPKDRAIGRDFLIGANISWYELGLHYDVDRDQTTKLRRQIDSELKGKRTVRLNLYHAPGAGGTTVAKRLLWDFRTLVPCAALLRTDPAITAERLYRLVAITGQSVLLVVDGADIAERDADELYDQLKSRQVPVVIIQVLRRFKSQIEQKRSFYLSEVLSPGEAHRFAEIFGREQPDRRGNLDRLVRTNDARQRTAFYFGLETFGSDFKGLSPYVSARLEGLTGDQRQMLAYTAMAHHYAQRPVNRQAFSTLIGLSGDRAVDLRKTFPSSTCELIVETESGAWRTAHDLIAVEVLRQVLWPSDSDKRNWKQNLSTWAIQFAELCRGAGGSVASDELKDIVTRAFIYRDNSDLLGTERAGASSFSQLIEDIPSVEGRLTVLKTLTQIYPEESHFWAHTGRFYTIELRDFERALECISTALVISPDDPVLHHMRGMALRHQITELLRSEGWTLDQIVSLMKAASGAFQEARELKPDDEHAYISDVQMIARVLDHLGRNARGNNSDLFAYLASVSVDPYLRDSFQYAEDLLERVRRNREGENPSQFEEDCRARLDSLYGKHDRALQTWDSMLARKEMYHPPIRRQIIWTYLARKDRSWAALDPREVNRIAELLEQNLQEEPNQDQNFRLWIQVVRRLAAPPPLESIIEKVSYWRTNSGSLDSVYYLYVLYALDAIEGSRFARENALKYMSESRTLARSRRNRTKSLEWIGGGVGIKKMIHHSDLGLWNNDRDYWESPVLLARLRGRIAKIEGNQAGYIEVPGELTAFFVPVREGFSKDRSENVAVEFNLGFSYDGLRAWNVKAVTG